MHHSYFSKTCGRIEGHSSPANADELGVEVRVEPVGEWSDWYPFGSVERRHRAGRYVFKAIRDFTVPKQSRVGSDLNAGIDAPEGELIRSGEEFFTQPDRQYYSEFRRGSGADH